MPALKKKIERARNRVGVSGTSPSPAPARNQPCLPLILPLPWPLPRNRSNARRVSNRPSALTKTATRSSAARWALPYVSHTQQAMESGCAAKGLDCRPRLTPPFPAHQGDNVHSELKMLRTKLADVWQVCLKAVRGPRASHTYLFFPHGRRLLSQAVAKKVQSSDFGDALAAYRSFMSYTLGEEQTDLCPLLHYLHENGDTSVHTWKTVSGWREEGGQGREGKKRTLFRNRRNPN